MKQFKYMALAALVAFAACDEGTDVVVTPEVTGEIAGIVTIEGAGAAGVTVTASFGETKVTDGSGAYSFTGVPAGAYTLTISGFASDATFSSTSKAASITTTGQVATVNFDGAYVRTAAILGSVCAGGSCLKDVTVSIGTKSTLTDANGQYAFSGLRAGTYTVTMSGFDAQHYSFANTTQDVTVGVGESKIASFAGQLLATATISGTLFIDGNGNEAMDQGEPPVAKAGIMVALEYEVGTDSLWTATDANGMYSFADLEEGSYKVILLPQDEFPGAFTQSGSVRQIASVTSGSAATVNFPFEVTTQYVMVYGMLGRDERNVGIAPIKGWSIGMFPTELDANASTGAITTAVKTDAAGMSTFKFLRSKDHSPNSAVVDGIVFAKVSAPSASYKVSGETVIEIPWLPMDSIVMAPDTFDATYSSVTVKVRAQEIDGDSLPGWGVGVWVGSDTTGAGKTGSLTTNAKGNGYYGLTAPTGIGADTFPVVAHFRLNATQPATHTWTQTPMGTATKGRFLKVSWDGTVLPSDTIDGGSEDVKYTTVDVMVQVHRELDDTLGYSAGDGLTIGGNGIAVELRKSPFKTADIVGGGTAAAGVGTVTIVGVDVTKSYQLRARSLGANFDVLNDTLVATTFDGSDEITTPDWLEGSAGPSAFMVKRNNNTIDGRVKSRLGAMPVNGVVVTVAPTAMNIQGTAAKVDTTAGGLGAWDVAGLRDGPYTVTVSAGDSAWTFLRTLKTTKVPAASAVVSGTVDNDSPTVGTRDLSVGVGGSTANFEAYRTDTKFSGLVVNDRDTDLTTIDPGEALAGAVINLYRDDDTGATAGTDTLTGTATTDAGGAYSFTNLIEGRYTAVWAAGTPTADVQVSRALTVANASTTKVSGTPVFGTNVANTAAALPAWNYNTSAILNGTDANFTFLYANTEVRGTIKKLSDGTTAVAGVTVTAKRCHTATTAVLTRFSGPINASGADFCTAYFSGSMSTLTDASGVFSFANLTEGIYEVTVLPGSLAPYTTIDRSPVLYWTLGSGDIESAAYLIS
jgi:hypothetical protein